MAITNTSKPSSSVTNATKINIGDTWNAILTTWASETRSWDATGSLVTNISKGISGFLWSVNRFPWTEIAPWSTEGGIINVTRPS
jgi:hypothetical protein